MTKRPIACGAVVVFVAATVVGQATVPYGGIVMGVDSSLLPDGGHPMTFSIWSEPEGGELLWEEHHAAIPVRGGSFMVQVNPEIPIVHSRSDLWLEVTVEWGVLEPRTSLDWGDGVIAVEKVWIEGSSRRIQRSVGSDALDLINVEGYIRFWPRMAPDENWAQLSVDIHTGGLMHLWGGSDVSLQSGSGFLQLGGATGWNLVLDENEIQARDEGAAAPLYLQKEGGDVHVGASVVHSSDLRQKQEIRDLGQGLDELLRLRSVSFASKGDPGMRRLGLIAQEVEQVVEEVVYENEDGMLGIAYQNLVPLLIRAVQDQQTEIERLRTDLENLRVRVGEGSSAPTTLHIWPVRGGQ